jgi:membrane protein involved in colicin uptake
MAGIVSLIFSKWGLYAALAIGALYVLHLHDNAVRAAMDAKATAAIAEQSAADQVRVDAAVKAKNAAEHARRTAMQNLRDTINAEPHSTACATSPALRDLFNGLRGPSGSVSETKPAR